MNNYREIVVFLAFYLDGNKRCRLLVYSDLQEFFK